MTASSKLRSTVIVGPDDRRTIGRHHFGKEPHLGLEIGVHRLMIIEMIAAEIGEGGGPDRKPLGAILRKTVARCLKGRMGNPHSVEAGHVRQESDHVGRGQARGTYRRVLTPSAELANGDPLLIISDNQRSSLSMVRLPRPPSRERE